MTADFENCTGCRACEQICPKDCIILKTNNEGFLYPELDTNTCIECKRCLNVCPIVDENLKQIKHESKQMVYACYAKNESIRAQSSSGGIFAVIAEFILESKGIVYGACFDEDFYLHHQKVTNIDDLNQLKGSKYLQSDTLFTYKEVKEDLKEGKFVYYTGAPCQIAGLRLFLGKNYKNLLTSDFICHGVPSPLFFKKYKDYLEHRFKGEMTEYKFRKTNGWAINEEITINRHNKEIKRIIPKNLSSFFKAYLNGDLNRISCYDCKYTTKERVGDITLADFWGIENYLTIDTSKGVSLILENTETGREMIDKIKSKLAIYEFSIDYTKGNGNLYMSSNKSSIRANIYKKLNKNGIEYLFSHDLHINGMIIPKLRRFITHFLDDYGFKNIIKKYFQK